MKEDINKIILRCKKSFSKRLLIGNYSSSIGTQTIGEYESTISDDECDHIVDFEEGEYYTFYQFSDKKYLHFFYYFKGEELEWGLNSVDIDDYLNTVSETNGYIRKEKINKILNE